MAKYNDSSPEGRSVRLLRVGEQVRHILSELLLRGEAHDDALGAHSVSVTEVRMSPDLRHATVFVRPMLNADSDEIVTALKRNTGFFQREVAGRMKTKYAARLNFRLDESFDEAAHIDSLLRDPKVARDLD